MPKTIEITIYQYNELSEKAKERARDNYLTNWMHDDWSDCTLANAKEDGALRGFNIKDIRYSGFWSQGDGASWCGAVRVRDWIASKPTAYQDHPTTQIILALMDAGAVDEQVLVSFSSSRYCHENTMDVPELASYEPTEDGDEPVASGMFKGASIRELSKIINCEGGALHAMSVEIEADCKAFAREIYRALEDDYNASTTDEAIAENYDCNDIYFHPNGTIA